MSSARYLSKVLVLILVIMLALTACVRPFTDGEGTSTGTVEETPTAEAEEAETSDAEEQEAEAPADVSEEETAEAPQEVQEPAGGDSAASAGQQEAESTSAEGADAEAAAAETTSETEEAAGTEGEAAPTEQTQGSGEEVAVTTTEGEAAGEDATAEEGEAATAITSEEAVSAESEAAETPESGEEAAIATTTEWADPMMVYTPTTHVVARGENLYRIGLQYGMSWVTLARYNHIRNPNWIYAGQVIQIPPMHSAPMYPAPMPEGEPESPSFTNYMVKPGDNLFRIGLAFGVSWLDIAEANGIMNPHQIVAGQVLKIPPASVPGTMPDFQHMVRPGETLPDIAIMYGIQLTTIAQANGLTPPYTLMPGQVLIIPGG